MKRTIDVLASALGLICISPVLAACAVAIKFYDNGPILYTPDRAGKDCRPFKMFKLRSMVINSDKIGGSSTSSSDPRITPIGKYIRSLKLDEFMQLFNVLSGDMSLVGPRPNLVSEIEKYSAEEKRLLSVKPGITDFSSIVFSDEGKVLEGRPDPDLSYNQLIRPWKSRLGLFYIEHQNNVVDLILVILTIVAIVNRELALSLMGKLLCKLDASDDLIRVASRKEELTPFPPPGMNEIILKL